MHPEQPDRTAASSTPPGPTAPGQFTPDERRARRQAALKTTGHGIATTAKATGRGLRATAKVTAAGTRRATRAFQRYASSQGADQTGLDKMIGLHFSHTAGDTIMTMGLAGTVFFGSPTTQARGQVALFLLMTMVPFAVVAPFIGPFLDNFRHGRRWAIGATMAVRAFLCWVLAEGLNNDSTWIFPAALGCLVASRAYNITRASAVPRLVPDGLTLVNANSKISMAGVIGASLGGAVGAAFIKLGPSWGLRLAFLIFVLGTVQAIKLPAAVDSAEGEEGLEDKDSPTADAMRTGEIVVQRPVPRGNQDLTQAIPATRELHQPAGQPPPKPSPSGHADSAVVRFRERVKAMPWAVMGTLWSTSASRILTGFFVMYLAFLTRDLPPEGVRGELVLACSAVAYGVGNALGSLLGNLVKDHAPSKMAVIVVLLAIAAAIAAALWYSLWLIIALGFANGFSAQVSKLALDAVIQRDIPETIRTSVFAWSETMLQIMWVVGGTLGICLPLIPWLGFSTAAVAMAAALLMGARARRQRLRPGAAHA